MSNPNDTLTELLKAKGLLGDALSTVGGGEDGASIEQNVLRGRLLIADGKYQDAIPVLQEVQSVQPDNAPMRHLLAEALAHEAVRLQDDGDENRALDLLLESLSLSPTELAMRNARSHLSERCRWLELCDLLDRAAEQDPEFIARGMAEQEVEIFRQARERGAPGLILNTLPKSASVFIWDALCRRLGAARGRISTCLFPVDHMAPKLVKQLHQGGVVAHVHSDASDHNFRALNAAEVPRIMAQVRDPRQATLSWCHHVVNNCSNENFWLRTRMHPRPRDTFDQWPLEDRLNWTIQNHLPAVVQWIADWVEAEQNEPYGIKVWITRFEDFTQDNNAFVDQVLEYHGLDPKQYPDHSAKTGTEGKLHFRSGRTDEWREVFTQKQQDMAWDMMPDHLCERFGWDR